MKKLLLFLSALLACAITFYLFSNKHSNNIDGKITYCEYNNNTRGTYIWDTKTHEQSFIPNCMYIRLLEFDKALIGRYNTIEKFDTKTQETISVYNIGEVMDYFTMVSDSIISFSDGEVIYTFDLEDHGKNIVVEDNGAKYHGWLEGRLIYANIHDEIIEYNLYDKTKNKLFDGREPIVSADNNFIAYKDIDGNLHVFNIKTNEQYSYTGSAYYYCFSPKSDMLLIEDEMKFFKSLKNILFNERIIGHRVLAWDYKNNTTSEMIEECTAGAGEGFSWK